ncbi:MAG TPA: DNA alkylation repair protein [Methanolinea sp.]|nr:DNA alkylation repair protein [Methanolinea sp.]
MDPVISLIREELEKHADPGIRKSSRRFFREPVTCYGMKTTTATTIAKKYWATIRSRDKKEILSLCEELYRSGYLEESFIASEWARRLSLRYDREDSAVFRHWIEAYITNWASCDGFCNHAAGDFIGRFPDSISELEQWTRSENRWLRRAAAVSLILPAKHGKFLDESISIATLLLTDGDDMVQEGYGWLLKEASRKHAEEVFSFVMENRDKMPGTALRNAIGLMPAALKAEAMKRDRC